MLCFTLRLAVKRLSFFPIFFVFPDSRRSSMNLRMKCCTAMRGSLKRVVRLGIFIVRNSGVLKLGGFACQAKNGVVVVIFLLPRFPLLIALRQLCPLLISKFVRGLKSWARRDPGICFERHPDLSILTPHDSYRRKFDAEHHPSDRVPRFMVCNDLKARQVCLSIHCLTGSSRSTYTSAPDTRLPNYVSSGEWA